MQSGQVIGVWAVEKLRRRCCSGVAPQLHECASEQSIAAVGRYVSQRTPETSPSFDTSSTLTVKYGMIKEALSMSMQGIIGPEFKSTMKK